MTPKRRQAMSHFDRNLRQLDIVPDHKLLDLHCVVIGVGAIGRQVALQLTAMGARYLHLIDPDTVEEVNLATQGYKEADLGELKVVATGKECYGLNAEINLYTHDTLFQTAGLCSENLHAVFCCVDSITARQQIWRLVRAYKQFWVDGRMLGETIRVLCTAGQHDKYYRTTVFPQKDALHGRCTARATIYSSNVVAGMMLAQFTRWLREEFYHPDILFNLATMDMFYLCEDNVG
jgi:molybdopterin-synthase adenylyltransferase